MISAILAAAPAAAECNTVQRICTGVTITQMHSGTIGSTGEAAIYTSGDESLLPCAASGNSLLIDLSKPGADVVVAQALTLYSLGRPLTVRLEENVPTCIIRWIMSE